MKVLQDLNWRRQSFRKNCDSQGKTRWYWYRTLEDLLRIFWSLFMKNVGISKDSLMVKSLLEILTRRRSQTFCKLVDVFSVINVLGESISSIHMWNIVNQYGKYDFFVWVGSWKRTNFFLLKWIDTALIWFLPANCSTIENLRCLNSAVNEVILLTVWSSKKAFFRQYKPH